MGKKTLPDIIGQVFDRLPVIKEAEPKKSHRMVECKCSCGNLLTTRVSALLSGNTKSCGCFCKETRKRVLNKFKTIHGDTIGGRSPEHQSWSKMLGRCYNLKDQKYKHYGGRGIIVCDRWKTSYVNFLEDMGRRLSPIHTLDRINVNGNYEPDNCRWATPKEQSSNQRRNVYYIVGGEKICQSEFARRIGTDPSCIAFFRKRGYTTEQIINYYKNKQNHATPIGTDSIQ